MMVDNSLLSEIFDKYFQDFYYYYYYYITLIFNHYLVYHFSRKHAFIYYQAMKQKFLDILAILILIMYNNL